jgi:hypothetical protein
MSRHPPVLLNLWPFLVSGFSIYVPIKMNPLSEWATDQLHHDGIFMDNGVFAILASSLTWGKLPLLKKIVAHS